jgi:hypothetical protein
MQDSVGGGGGGYDDDETRQLQLHYYMNGLAHAPSLPVTRITINSATAMTCAKQSHHCVGHALIPESAAL